MTVRIAVADKEIAACYPVMRELRPHITEADFVSRVRRQEKAGYRLAYLEQPEGVVAVAGFRLGDSLAWGRFLYVDDLVTSAVHRSKGFGSALLAWLRRFGIDAGCQQLHLDSGIQRKGAHRFYEREGMTLASYHFAENLAPESTLDSGADAH